MVKESLVTGMGEFAVCAVPRPRKQASKAPALQVTPQKNRGSARQDLSSLTLGSQR
jgi:hypothetical protein